MQAASAIQPLFSSARVFRTMTELFDRCGKGDQIWVCAFELQHASVNGRDRLAAKVFGYSQQQRVIPSMIAASSRGSDVRVVVNASNDEGPSENLPMIDHLRRHGIDIRPYPADLAVLNHSKNVAVVRGTDRGTEYSAFGGGGINLGNFSAAHVDSLPLFTGVPAYNMLIHVIRPQWIVSGGDGSLIPGKEIPDHVKWLNTAPPEEDRRAKPQIKSAARHLIGEAVRMRRQGESPHIRAGQLMMTETTVVRELIEAAKEGVLIDLLLDPTAFSDSRSRLRDDVYSAREALVLGGARVWMFVPSKRVEGQLFHGKVFTLSVFRDEKEVPLELLSGTANATFNGLVSTPGGKRTNRESAAVISDRQTVKAYNLWLDALIGYRSQRYHVSSRGPEPSQFAAA